MDFTVTKKGYSTAEVDKYIDALKREYGNTIVKQRDRIAELIEENKKAAKELEAYREKSSQISKAIVGAVAKAEEIEHLSRIKYSQELARLKAFHDKWTRYYSQILDEYPLDGKLKAAAQFNKRMDKILSPLGGDVAAATAEPEQEEGEFNPIKKLDEYFASAESESKPPRKAEKETAATVKTAAKKDYADRSESGFSFEEALNPTEDLESILKDLGM